MYNYSWKEDALRQLGKLTMSTTSLIYDKVANYLTLEPRNNSKTLHGRHKGLWRYRVGDYRVTYAIDEPTKTITITRVSHRKDGY